MQILNECELEHAVATSAKFRAESIRSIYNEIHELNAGSKLHQPEGGFQDSAYFAQIIIPHNSGAMSKVVFSEVGNLVGISNEHDLDANLRAIIAAILRAGGVYVPELILRSPYTGPDQGYDSWWHRYFDYQ